jgi:adenosylmethionine-8-amino-7-oxononanoate aminotransferase
LQPGYIYEVVYEARGPLVQGLGLAGIRDLVSVLKHDSSPGNPLAAAPAGETAAAANLEIWESEPVLERIAALSRRQGVGLAPFAADGRFENVRQAGTITALDVTVSDNGYLAGIGPRLYADFLARGVLLRPLGNTIYVMPPYCTGTKELDDVYQAIRDGAENLVT